MHLSDICVGNLALTRHVHAFCLHFTYTRSIFFYDTFGYLIQMEKQMGITVDMTKVIVSTP